MAACDSCGDGSADVARLWKQRYPMYKTFFFSAEADGRGGGNEAHGVAEDVLPFSGGAKSAGRATGAGANGGRDEVNRSVTVRFSQDLSTLSARGVPWNLRLASVFRASSRS